MQRHARILMCIAGCIALVLSGCSSGDPAPVASAASTASAPLVTVVPPALSTVASNAPTPTAPPLTANPLTGGPLIATPVIAVKVDNTSAGLPQYGLTDADVVYVEQVEGGLTRLMAVFHTTLPPDVGAVRSVRSTDAELLPVFGAPALVFSGGAGGPLAALATTPTVAVSEDAGGAGFSRTSSSPAPFNLHSDVKDVAAAHPDLTPPRDIGFHFVANDPRVAAAPAATSLAVKWEAADTEFGYADGRYRLERDGDPASDASGAPVVADNVLFQDVELDPDGTVDSVGSPSFISHTVGKGTFTLYRDGHAITGKWSRAAANLPTEYLDASGQPVPFKPGKTWVALVPPTAKVTAS